MYRKEGNAFVCKTTCSSGHGSQGQSPGVAAPVLSLSAVRISARFSGCVTAGGFACSLGVQPPLPESCRQSWQQALSTAAASFHPQASRRKRENRGLLRSPVSPPVTLQQPEQRLVTLPVLSVKHFASLEPAFLELAPQPSQAGLLLPARPQAFGGRSLLFQEEEPSCWCSRSPGSVCLGSLGAVVAGLPRRDL